MKVEEILKLKEAGFDNDSIIKFANAVERLDAEEQKPEIPAEKPAEDAKPIKPIKPVQEIPEWVSALTSELQGLRKTIQASNVRSVQENDIIKPKTAVEVMAEVLNAPGGKTK